MRILICGLMILMLAGACSDEETDSYAGWVDCELPDGTPAKCDFPY